MFEDVRNPFSASTAFIGRNPQVGNYLPRCPSGHNFASRSKNELDEDVLDYLHGQCVRIYREEVLQT